MCELIWLPSHMSGYATALLPNFRSKHNHMTKYLQHWTIVSDGLVQGPLSVFPLESKRGRIHPGLKLKDVAHCIQRSHRKLWTFLTFIMDVKMAIWALMVTLVPYTAINHLTGDLNPYSLCCRQSSNQLDTEPLVQIIQQIRQNPRTIGSHETESGWSLKNSRTQFCI